MIYPIIRIGKDSDPNLDGNSFVGVSKSLDPNKLAIVVPYGVEIPNEIDDSKDEHKADYSFLLRYVKAIQKALSSNYVKERLDEKAGIHNPIAAINITHDYLSMGKFIEFESRSKIAENGKIDFNQTIKKVRPSVYGNEIFYDQFITRKREITFNNFIAQVQCNIINHFMRNGGAILFGQSISIPIKKLNLDGRTIRLLRQELTHTFNSRKENLIRWCISYIEGLRNLNESDKNNGDWNYAIIASTLWEVMIESVMGNQLKRDKAQYGKTYEFTNLEENTSKRSKPTQHDTIYEDKKSVVIIDAKMYGSKDNLLSDKVLGKQFGYYEQAKMVKEGMGEEKNIINILMLPHDIDTTQFPYFQEIVIMDPHTPANVDPNKIIYIYEYPVKELIDDYYYGRKKSNFLLDEFKRFIQRHTVKDFLTRRGCAYTL
jgi:hypothetical protein